MKPHRKPDDLIGVLTWCGDATKSLQCEVRQSVRRNQVRVIINGRMQKRPCGLSKVLADVRSFILRTNR